MRLPVDASRLQALAVSEAEPKREFVEGKRKEECAPVTDSNGELVWEIKLVLMGDGDAEIIKVSVVGDPKLKQGELVRLEEMTAQPYTIKDDKSGKEKSGVSFRAAAIRPMNTRPQAEKAAA